MDNSFKYKLKICCLKLKKFLRICIKKFNLAILLFLLSFVMFFMVLIPSLAQKLPCYDMFIKVGNFPTQRTLSGTVAISEANVDETINKYLPNIEIFCGGFKTYTDENGEFSLKIISNDYNDVPIIIKYKNETYIFWAQFDNNSYKSRMEFIINEK